ncbi:hypothetical protein IC229_17950 [Spirosoma sp. BT702]|uniref:Uncharacterized protein n=1 Tax=Spirosoma profusum TaxID=2771354 RepID=A0A927ARN5_9BACT|nr:hypothetical protein [Spirosoma profusum]MBD2702536.1 hypothetical protein [Spirosoma profusum]
MKRLGNFVAIALLFVQCSSSVDPQNPENLNSELIVRSGTSFGFCLGYCQKNYVFDKTNVTLNEIANGRQPTQLDPRNCSFTISEADWNAVKASANLDAFSKQPETIGCPDCADGGAEYIELELSGQKHRVTFPHGGTIPGFEGLVENLRKLRETKKECQ